MRGERVSCANVVPTAELKFHFGTMREREIYSVSPQAKRMRACHAEGMEQSDQNANPVHPVKNFFPLEIGC